jgi:hypothetical protein
MLCCLRAVLFLCMSHQDGTPALLSACHAGHLEVAKWLVSEGLGDAKCDAVRSCRSILLH